MPAASGPEVLAVGPRPVDRRLLVLLAVGVLVVALVLGGLSVADQFRGGASSPVDLARRVVTAVDGEDVAALARLVEPDERAALTRLSGTLARRLTDLALPTPVVGDADASTDPLSGFAVDVSGSAPRVAAESGDVAVVDLGRLTVRVRSDPAAAHGLLRTWFAFRNVAGAQVRSYGPDDLPGLGSLPALVAVERSGRWYLSVVGTLLGPAAGGGNLPRVEALGPTWSPTPGAAVETTLRALLDGRTRTDAGPLARTLDASGSDVLQLWASEVVTTGLDRSPVPVTALTTTAGPAEGGRATVRVEALRVGDGSGLDLSGPCLRTGRERACLHPSGYRYRGGLGSLSLFELLGRDGSFSLTAVQGPDGWRTSLPESLADAVAGYAAGLTREQVLMVLAQEHLDTPSGELRANRAEDVLFTSAGYAVRTVHVGRAGLLRVVASPDGANRSTLYGPDGQPALQPFFPNDSVYRVAPGDHTLLVWADDGFTRSLDRAGGPPYAQRVEVRSVP